VVSRLPKPGRSLADLHPEVAAQADGWDPKVVAPASRQKLSWKCDREHIWEAVVGNRSRGASCPICANKRVVTGINDLATVNPSLALEADGWDPTLFMPGSEERVAWKCSNGHQWIARINNRSNGNGCPHCYKASRKTPSKPAIKLDKSEILQESCGWNSDEVSDNDTAERQWKCAFGHEWTASVGYRLKKRKPCPICSRLKPGVNDYATTHPDQAREADGWDPTLTMASSKIVVAWKCSQGHEWMQSPRNRRNAKNCKLCYQQKGVAKPIIGVNDLATTNPELAAQAHGWDPTTVVKSTYRHAEWQCEVGHVWSAEIRKRSQGSSCPFCAGLYVDVGVNDLATVRPDLAAEADGWDPRTVTCGSGKKRAWICTEGHRWKSVVSHRTDGTGCPSCARSGFDPNKDGWLYLIDHDDLDMFQIGISNVPDGRLGQHSKRGWEVQEVRGPMEGHLTQELEKAILRAVERRGGVLGHKAGIEKFDGYSEAWTKDSLRVSSFKQLMDWVHEDEYPGK